MWQWVMMRNRIFGRCLFFSKARLDKPALVQGVKKSRNMKHTIGIVLFVMALSGISGTSAAQQRTYCNPLDLDYTYMIRFSHKDISYRSGADPDVVEFRNEYYMFVTRSMGYWHSRDMLHWDFIEPEGWYFQGSNAPTAFNYKDSLLYQAGNPSGSMSILYTDKPEKGVWQAVPSILHRLQDPTLFIDHDDQAYIFWGSSNKHPIRGRKLDMFHRFSPDPNFVKLINLEAEKHGWERFGTNHSDSIRGYIEGAYMTRHNDQYYLQYAAPGTQFDVYGEGVYIGDAPLGPYRYAPNNPVCYKPGGFANGAGHGSTLLGPYGNYWHFATMAVSVNRIWERRIVMYPTYFDQEGLIYSNTSFGDYPHYAPDDFSRAGEFTGWMLLSYDKPVKASSSLANYSPENTVDENVKTFWVAGQNDDQQWLEIDLETPATVHAVQINYNDYHTNLYGRIPGLYHRYVIEGSRDGNHWELLVDKTDSYEDAPNDYVELHQPRRARYIRYKNIHVPTPNLSISDLRIFGLGPGDPPAKVEDLKVNRGPDRRNAYITWQASDIAQGYNVRWGIAPDKLYSSWLVYGQNHLDLRSLNVEQGYFFTVEAFNENGVAHKSDLVQAR